MNMQIKAGSLREQKRVRAGNLKAHAANLPTPIAQTKRKHIEAAIEKHLADAEALILTLDLFDGDADFEDERSDYEMTNGGGTLDALLDDLEDDTADKEPSLGWTIDGEIGGVFDHEEGVM